MLDAAKSIGARVWVTNEYTHVQVDQPILINQALRRAGQLSARPGPFGETLDTFASAAFAVCDHQIAHVYTSVTCDTEKLRDLLVGLPGVDKVYWHTERANIGLDHVRAGDFVVLAQPNAWFAYPFWLDERVAPDYAAPWTSIASPATIRANSFSTRPCVGQRAMPPGGFCKKNSAFARFLTLFPWIRIWCAAAMGCK